MYAKKTRDLRVRNIFPQITRLKLLVSMDSPIATCFEGLIRVLYLRCQKNRIITIQHNICCIDANASIFFMAIFPKLYGDDESVQYGKSVKFE